MPVLDGIKDRVAVPLFAIVVTAVPFGTARAVASTSTMAAVARWTGVPAVPPFAIVLTSVLYGTAWMAASLLTTVSPSAQWRDNAAAPATVMEMSRNPAREKKNGFRFRRVFMAARNLLARAAHRQRSELESGSGSGSGVRGAERGKLHGSVMVARLTQIIALAQKKTGNPPKLPGSVIRNR